MASMGMCWYASASLVRRLSWRRNSRSTSPGAGSARITIVLKKQPTAPMLFGCVRFATTQPTDMSDCFDHLDSSTK
jgi:hypothetical protein